jgi:hypothetical protein
VKITKKTDPAKRPRGRPAKPDSRKYTVKLSDAIAEKARRLGDKDMTRGIELAVKRAREPSI